MFQKGLNSECESQFEEKRNYSNISSVRVTLLFQKKIYHIGVVWFSKYLVHKRIIYNRYNRYNIDNYCFSNQLFWVTYSLLKSKYEDFLI